MHIAICGELGAGCTEVGQILSRKLNIRCLNSSEIIRSLVSDFSESFADFELHIRSGEVDLDAMIDGKIDELMSLEVLIVEGRSGFMLLDKEEAFKVLLISPKDKRAEHISNRRGITIEEAEEELQVSDTERKHMVERLFKKDWLDPHNYDLVINTGKGEYEEIADFIIRAGQKR